jgi:hypothetical protein
MAMGFISKHGQLERTGYGHWRPPAVAHFPECCFQPNDECPGPIRCPQLPPIEASGGGSPKPTFVVPMCWDLLRVSPNGLVAPRLIPPTSHLSPKPLHPESVPTVSFGKGTR